MYSSSILYSWCLLVSEGLYAVYAAERSCGCWNCLSVQFWTLNVIVRELCALYTIQLGGVGLGFWVDGQAGLVHGSAHCLLACMPSYNNKLTYAIKPVPPQSNGQAMVNPSPPNQQHWPPPTTTTTILTTPQQQHQHKTNKLTTKTTQKLLYTKTGSDTPQTNPVST